MAMNPVVSAVVLTRNSSRSIVKCLDSIINSEYKVREIIVVDGGSTDGTLDLIESYKPAQDIKVVSDQQKGLGFARDIGWRSSTGAYIIYIDSDVVIDRELIGDSLVIMERDRTLGGISGKLDPKCDEQGLISLWMEKNVAISYHKSVDAYPSLEKESLHTGATTFRRSALEEVGGFDHEMALALEDWTISYRLRRQGYRLAYIDILCSHLETSRRFSRINIRYGKARTICQRKGYPIVLFPLRLKLTLLCILVPPLAFMLILHYYEIHRRINKRLSALNRLFLAAIEVWRLLLRISGIVFEILFGRHIEKSIKPTDDILESSSK